MRVFPVFIIILTSIISWSQSTVQQVVKKLNKHKYSQVYRCFDQNMKNKVPVADLKKLWEEMELSAGDFLSIDDVEVKPQEGGSKQTAVIKFDLAALKVILAENKDGEIVGLYITQLGYTPPVYAEGLGTGKKYINFFSDGFELSGELVIPLDCKKCPVVILVHGSGPNDRDETIGPNKVFYDIALGLASQGVASYRYDKRSKLYPEVLEEQFDLYDETINDAIAAFYTIKNDTSLDFGSYVMLGHSLGAYSMPLIADSLSSDLTGAVLFSANARKLEDLIEYQMDYLTGFDGVINKEEATIIEENRKKAENIRTGQYTLETKSEDLLAYWPGTFWKRISTYNPVTTLTGNVDFPFLILQGEKDYQITMTDFGIWKSATKGLKTVQLKSYPKLTHLFSPTDADRSSPGDYFLPNNVDYKVIQDIAKWAKELSN